MWHGKLPAVAPPNMHRERCVAASEEMQLIYSEVAANCSGERGLKWGGKCFKEAGGAGRPEENCCCRKLLLQFLLFLCARRNVCNIIFALLAATAAG